MNSSVNKNNTCGVLLTEVVREICNGNLEVAKETLKRMQVEDPASSDLPATNSVQYSLTKLECFCKK